MQKFLEDTFLPLLFKASWQAAVVILVVLAAQWIFGRRMSPRLRYGLWLLVAVRLVLPATLPSNASLFNLSSYLNPTKVATLQLPSASSQEAEIGKFNPKQELAQGNSNLSGTPQGFRQRFSYLAFAWGAGALVMTLCFVVTHFRFSQRVASSRSLIDSRVLNLLEDCRQQMDVCAPVALVETNAVDGPCLFGFLRPRLLLPPGFTQGFSDDELCHVFLHELGHVKRHDIFVGWMMAALQVLHWFNPLVWVAIARIRVDRELACDALALSRSTDSDNQTYGRTILKLLENFCDPVKAPSLAGIAEDKKQMKERIVMIANFKKTNRASALAALLFIVLGLVTLTDAQQSEKPSAAPTDPQAPPAIVSTSPEVGATDVDPSLTEITVTFDRDMGRGMSWTGGGPDFPGIPNRKAKWRDKRTCVLPVTLDEARYYRVGINSKSFQNFRSAAGVAALPSAIYFTTHGASDALKAKVLTPHVVRFSPENGPENVPVGLSELRVTFDTPMAGGFSWCQAGDDDHDFPKIPDGQRPRWTEDKKTAILPVQLKPGMTYRVILNAPGYNNFQSANGVPLAPVTYTFKTGNL
ncbi:MAG TPA: M56 family metallopeptidase [Verrucomicrobiae bacterium]|jgi:beta-lactamase regulating signal transducer with metallopeptidase domain